QERFERARDGVGPVAEIDAHAAEADAKPHAFQPRRTGAVHKTDAARIEETDRLQPAVPSHFVFEVEQAERVAGRRLEVVAVHRSDAADREEPLRRELATGPAADRPRAKGLILGQEHTRAGGDDVAAE